MGATDVLGPRSNALTQLRRLSGRRRARRDAGRFVIDGPTLVAEALRSPVEVLEVYAEPSADPAVLAEAASAGVRVLAVAEGALAQVTDPVTPQGVAALAVLPETSLDLALDAPRPPGPGAGSAALVLVLVGIADPGNAGTLLRVAEAADATAVVSCGDGVDLWNPKCVRAAAGSLFRVPVAEHGDPLEVLDRLGVRGVTSVATVLDAPVSLDDAALDGPVAVVLGSEAHGLPASVASRCDLRVRIPTAGEVESLNVAMAGTVVAFEIARRRRSRRDEESGPSN